LLWDVFRECVTSLLYVSSGFGAFATMGP